MHIEQIPILSDNYSYLIVDEATGEAAAIDPAEPDVVALRIEALGVTLTHVLCTHHHWDHAGGNLEMKRRFPHATIVGSAADAPRIAALDQAVHGGDRVRVGQLEGQVLLVPCHTRGHVAYHFEDALFCGDTLFVAGCGRFFEGDAAEMHRALSGVFGALPDETRVFCGHEYTVANLRFAQTIEPDNDSLRAKLAWAEARRDRVLPTVPSTLGEERRYNPFMRVHLSTLQARVDASDAVHAMARLRALKNEFK